MAMKSNQPRTFGGLLRGRSAEVRRIATALRDLVLDELPEAVETFHGGARPLAMYRTVAEVCWIQPLTARCNVYFTRGTELADPDGLLTGSSDRQRHVKVPSVEDVESLPIRAWIRESVALNDAVGEGAIAFDDALARLRKVALALPNTKETLTWGRPHFRVGEKIFCGCGEEHGRPILGLKMEPAEANLLIGAPGVTKARYSRPNDGWVAIDPGRFDDWDEIARLVVGSFRLIAPKRTLKLLDEWD